MQLPQKRILIVDDDSAVVEMLRMALSGAGYSTEIATTGKQALEKVGQSKPDLILLDLKLPEVNGLTVCETLRRQAATASVRIIIMTGLPGALPQLALVDGRADAYLPKPFSIQEMLSRVGDVIKHANGNPGRETAQV